MSLLIVHSEDIVLESLLDELFLLGLSEIRTPLSEESSTTGKRVAGTLSSALRKVLLVLLATGVGEGASRSSRLEVSSLLTRVLVAGRGTIFGLHLTMPKFLL